MPDLAYQSLAVLVFLLGLVLFYWAMFRDRSRGRRRCPKCWYDLRGGNSLTCSECGYTARHERQLLKTRRKRRWVVAALFIAATAVPLGLEPQARQQGWLSVTPTTVIIASLPWTGEAGAQALSQRWDRSSLPVVHSQPWSWQERLTEWQARQLMDADQDVETRLSMLHLLSLISEAGDPLSPTILTWLDDSDAHIRAVAVSHANNADLDVVDEAALVKRLCELVQDKDADVRQLAVSSLGSFINGDPRARQTLIDGLWSQQTDVRVISVNAMSRLDTIEPHLLDRLVELVETHDRAGVVAAHALGTLGDATMAPVLIKGMDGPNQNLSSACACVLLRFGDGVRSIENTAALGALLDSDNAQVRICAIAALLGQGPNAMAYLQKMQSIPDSDSAQTLVFMLTSERNALLTPATAVPVLLAAIAQFNQTPDWQSIDQYGFKEAIKLLSRFTNCADQFLPLLENLLSVPNRELRESAVAALHDLGPAAASALPVLRERMQETTNPAENVQLQWAIDAISNDGSN